MEGTDDPGRREAGGLSPAGGAPSPPPLEAPSPSSREASGGDGRGLLGDVSALLQNRFILFGLGALAVLLLLTIVLVVVGDGDDDPAGSTVRPATPSDEETPVTLVGLPGELLSTTTMRNGPDTTYAILGTIPQGARVPVVGRNEDATWLQVIYPPGSQLRGWVSATVLEVDGDVAELVLAGPGTGPQIPIPTSFGFITPFVPVEETPTPPEEPPATRARPTRTPVPSATRIVAGTSTPGPPQPTAAQ